MWIISLQTNNASYNLKYVPIGRDVFLEQYAKNEIILIGRRGGGKEMWGEMKEQPSGPQKPWLKLEETTSFELEVKVYFIIFI